MHLFLLLLYFIPACFAAIVTVFVGANEDGSAGLVILPNIIHAQVGDTVQFQFRGGNHTITQSSFSAPCSQIFNTATQKKGIDSGFMKFDNTTGQIGVFSLAITQVDTPIWLFCAQTGHCKKGMVAAINPQDTGDKTFAAFQAQLASAAEPGYGVTADFTPPTANTPNPNSALGHAFDFSLMAGVLLVYFIL